MKQVFFYHLTWILGTVCMLCGIRSDVQAQEIGWGVGLRHDLYNRYTNPPDDIASPSAGSAILNVGLGPKFWIGHENFSLSPEVYFMWSPLALSLGEKKGLGALSFPMLVKLEFLGNSNLNNDGKLGFSIGGGIQYTRTELWGLNQDYEDQGVERGFFKTYIIEGDFGFGLSGFDIHLYLRYGWNHDTEARTWNIGIGYDFNIPRLIEAANSDF